MDELKQETELLIASGYKGEGFYSDGQRLGTHSVPRYLSNGIAAKAAEKRLQTSKIMLPAGGIRLGGSSNSNNMTPAQLAARAAQKRQLDKVWCGGSVVEQEAPTSVSSSPSDNVTPKRKLSFNIPEMDTQSKKKSRKTVIDLTTTPTSPSPNEEGWDCPTCTFHNEPIKLACQICLTERPHDDVILFEDDKNFWSCPQCTLKNEQQWSTCMACQYVYLQ